MTGGPRLAAEGTGVGVHNLANAAWDKMVGVVAAHVLAVSGRGGVVGCFSPVPDGGWGVGDGLGTTQSTQHKSAITNDEFVYNSF